MFLLQQKSPSMVAKIAFNGSDGLTSLIPAIESRSQGTSAETGTPSIDQDILQPVFNMSTRIMNYQKATALPKKSNFTVAKLTGNFSNHLTQMFSLGKSIFKIETRLTGLATFTIATKTILPEIDSKVEVASSKNINALSIDKIPQTTTNPISNEMATASKTMTESLPITKEIEVASSKNKNAVSTVLRNSHQKFVPGFPTISESFKSKQTSFDKEKTSLPSNNELSYAAVLKSPKPTTASVCKRFHGSPEIIFKRAKGNKKNGKLLRKGTFK